MLRLRFVTVMVAVVAGVCIAGCGGGGDGPVAEVNGVGIPKPMLAHWMSVVLGGDYAQNVGSRAPDGLVAEPADYDKCTRAGAEIKGKGAPLPESTLLARCKQLHEAVKLQALSYLIAVQWRVNEAKEYGEGVTDQEVRRQLERVKTEQFPKPGAFQAYLRERHWSEADEMYLLKRNLLDEKFFQRITREGNKSGGGRAVVTRLVEEANQKQTGKTTCKPGYIVWQCKQYKGSSDTQPPAVLVEQIARVAG